MFCSRSFIGLLTAIVAVLLFPSEGRALTAGPALVDIALEANSATTVQIMVGNNAAMYQTFDLATESFISSGEQGQPQFIGKEGASEWFITDASITLQPGENRRLPVSVRVPENVAPGSYHVALFVSERASAESGVTNRQRIGVLFFINVLGDSRVEWTNVSFTPVFSTVSTLGNAFDIRVENQGTTFGSPSGTVEVHSVFGVTKTVPLNPQAVRILPKSARSYTIGFGDLRPTKNIIEQLKQEWSGLAIGPYKAVMRLEGYDKPIEASFTVVPKVTLVLVGIVLSVLLLMGWWTKRLQRAV